ncbi:metal-dependent hydrolase [Paenibacillus sp. CC-CFT742]|uniref:metal-dependent hydrolase n=1 Tax=Paenibacillus TaxID=44249 RepID=UPI0020412E4A|nr:MULTISPECIES: metal-dependent hydrolase [Paenibacillus]MCM3204880.1 metal-dependent hydrolase [Paenibacillus illinoisensis]WJH29850.1 metal-dependent hydrolase [Paenibacillus sp. CC-CFT742]
MLKITYHGHSSVQLGTEEKSLIIDPFLRGNELAVTKPEDIKTDAVLLTHAHMDHILDAEPIAKANNAKVVAIVELATYMSWKGLDTIGMNMGGTVDLDFAQAKMIQAFHSSGIVLEEEQRIMYAGMPAGFIINIGGKTILHAGDTSLFSDMKMIGDRHQIDVAFLPIGGHFTMGPEDALQAAEWFNAELTIPVHYDTFPLIRQDSENFVQQLAAKGLKGQVLAPGESITL